MTDATPSRTHWPDLDIISGNPEELFEPLEELGRGAFGVVIKARNRRTNEIVAAKQISILCAPDEEVQAVRREIAMLQSCDHDNIVRYKGTYCTDSSLWLMMEYCEGGSLSALIAGMKRPLPESVISYVTREMIDGLRYLHRQRKIHRDIKSANVLLTADGRVKLADFGVSAQLKDSLARRRSFIGTVFWMAPEAIEERDYDERADIWSLGITVIEMAETQPPTAARGINRAMYSIPKDPPPTLQFRELWSPMMHTFIARCLVKDPPMRPTAAALATDPWLSAVNAKSAAKQLVSLLAEARQQHDLPDANAERHVTHRTASAESESACDEDEEDDTCILNTDEAEDPDPPQHEQAADDSRFFAAALSAVAPFVSLEHDVMWEALESDSRDLLTTAPTWVAGDGAAARGAESLSALRSAEMIGSHRAPQQLLRSLNFCRNDVYEREAITADQCDRYAAAAARMSKALSAVLPA